ncbi:helix-turn-helix transcriptional regulator [Fructilactobacillus myrtifloralis]|uniref:Helix-turn-helix transcriptional regulator n=1 Tax=Fructilactobacillus myrtifloralis TaxID=2940301 RepID=A0ABY5BPZ5_9LACO|nr:helix-turn-helix transcriptional regulator [Fructilactobacillus myrtifloralis]USS85117.1 helix-turn-helix transcriptional regulator [Fructilactobacillus myrtifloralis]
MIANKLNVLLAERQLTIKDVVDGTEISRGTISNLINKNTTSNVNLDTLNKICMFLKISPSDFFDFVPYDLEFNVEVSEIDIILRTLKRQNNIVNDMTDDIHINDTEESSLYRNLEARNVKNFLVFTVGEFNHHKHCLDSEINKIYEDIPLIFRKFIEDKTLQTLEFIALDSKNLHINLDSDSDTAFYFEFSWGYTKKNYKELKNDVKMNYKELSQKINYISYS